MGPFSSFHIPGQPQRPSMGGSAISAMAPSPPTADRSGLGSLVNRATAGYTPPPSFGQFVNNAVANYKPPRSFGEIIKTGLSHVSPQLLGTAPPTAPPPQTNDPGNSVFSGLKDYSGVFDYMGGRGGGAVQPTVPQKRAMVPAQTG